MSWRPTATRALTARTGLDREAPQLRCPPGGRAARPGQWADRHVPAVLMRDVRARFHPKAITGPSPAFAAVGCPACAAPVARVELTATTS